MQKAVSHHSFRYAAFYAAWFSIFISTTYPDVSGQWRLLIAVAGSAVLAITLAVVLVVSGLDRRIRDPGAEFVQTLLGVGITTTALYFASPADRALLGLLPPLWVMANLTRLSRRQVAVLLVMNLILYTFSQSSAIWGRDDIYYRSAILGFIALASFDMLLASTSKSIFLERLEQNGTVRQVAELREQVRKLTQQDEKTATLKIQYFMDMLRREKARVDRYGGLFSLILIEIDHFRALLGTHGDTVMTQVLLEFSERSQKNVREMDIVEAINPDDDLPVEQDRIGHINGARFAILLPATPFAGGMDCAERLHTAIDMRTFRSAAGGVAVTLSIGVTEYQKGESADDVLIRATKALLQAQRDGGDCVRGVKATRQ